MESKSVFPFILFPGMVNTHTHRGLQATQSSSGNFPLNTPKQGWRKQLIMTANGADCQGKQIIWTFLKQCLILHSPCASAMSEHKTSSSSHQNFAISIKPQTSNPRLFPFLRKCHLSFFICHFSFVMISRKLPPKSAVQ